MRGRVMIMMMLKKDFFLEPLIITTTTTIYCFDLNQKLDFLFRAFHVSLAERVSKSWRHGMEKNGKEWKRMEKKN